jgi:nitric oxide reductase subunit C
MTSKDDDPFGIFRLSYTAIVWISVAGLAAILVWIMWTMFMNTSAGTAKSQKLEVVRPTQTAEAKIRGGGKLVAAAPNVTVCTACHIIGGQGNQVCPDLSQIATIAAERIADPSYTGEATTVEEYIRESIVEPSTFCVPNAPGKVYCTDTGTSVMPVGLDKGFSDLDALVTYLAEGQ